MSINHAISCTARTLAVCILLHFDLPVFNKTPLKQKEPTRAAHGNNEIIQRNTLLKPHYSSVCSSVCTAENLKKIV